MRITEKLVSSLWQSHPVTYPVADTGEWLHIIFPGRTSNGGGSDFKDAIIGVNGYIVSGEVEVHVKSSQWHGHGHHQDPRYNNIVLHVVWQRDSQAVTRLQNGRVIPTICLEPLLTRLSELLRLPTHTPVSCPMVDSNADRSRLTALLTRAGLIRFRAKTAAYRKDMNKVDAEQVIYLGISRALGYAQNAGSFQKLAQRLPVAVLKQNLEPGFINQQALLLGHAGLLPSQRGRKVRDRTAFRLERLWKSAGVMETMTESDWCFLRVRPDNFPTRRIVALSCLLDRFGREGLVSAILRLVEKSPESRKHRWLENGLVVAEPGYWRNHCDFGVLSGRSSALIGYEKASAMIINIVLPFAAALANKNSDSKLKRKAIEIYGAYPGGGDNELTRHMRQQLKLGPSVRLSAGQQQGLIHLFQAYCRLRNCLDCPVALSRG